MAEDKVKKLDPVKVVAAVFLVITIIAVVANFINFQQILGKKPQRDSRDLDIVYDPMLFHALLIKAGVTLTDDPSNYCLTCDIVYSSPGPLSIELTSEELTSYLQSTNNRLGLLKNIQVRLGNRSMMEATADVDLTGYGYSFSGKIYAKGTIKKKAENSIDLEIEEAYAGPVPIPVEYMRDGEKQLEDAINAQLAKMPGLRIDVLEVENGKLRFEGEFPKRITAS